MLVIIFAIEAPFYSILFYSILFYSILFYSILFYSIQIEHLNSVLSEDGMLTLNAPTLQAELEPERVISIEVEKQKEKKDAAEKAIEKKGENENDDN